MYMEVALKEPAKDTVLQGGVEAGISPAVRTLKVPEILGSRSHCSGSQ